MSITGVGQIGTDNHNSSSNTWTTSATWSRTVNVGQLLLLIISSDNSETTDSACSLHTVTDSVGNTYYKARGFVNAQGSAGAGAAVSLFWTIATVQIQTSSTFTVVITNGSVTAKALTGYVFDIDAGTGFLSAEAGLDLANDGADAGSQAISGLTSREYLYVRAIAAETTSTTFTNTSGFTTITAAASAGGMASKGEFKIATSTGETSDPTTTAVDQASVFVALREIPRTSTAIPKRLVSFSSVSNATSYTTASYTGTLGRRQVVFVWSEAAASVATPTITGYTQINTIANAGSTIRVTAFSGIGTGSAGTITIDFGGQTQLHATWLIMEFENGWSVVQSAVAASNTATLSAFGASDNSAVAVGWQTGAGVNGGAQGDSGWTNVAERMAFETTFFPFNAIWRPDGSDLTPSISGATLFLALELARLQSVTLGQVSEADTAQAIVYDKRVTLGRATETDTAQAVTPHIESTLSTVRRAIAVQSLAVGGIGDITAYTKRWFRNGITPSATAARRLADGINQGLAQRVRVHFAHPNLHGLHADYDSGTNSELVTWRFACHTGPVTRQLRAHTVFLPLPNGATPAGAPQVWWVMKTGLTGSGSTTTQAAVTTPVLSTSTDITADELFAVEQLFDVAPDADYRFELHVKERARPISGTVYEVPRPVLYTDEDRCVDSTTIYQGGPITQQTLSQMFERAQDLYRLGQPLGWWTADLPGDERSRTTASARNLFDQTLSAPADTSPGWPVEVPYHGTLESADVPIMFWAYASAVGGTSTLTLRDQAGAVVATLSPAGAADWYAAAGTLKDRRSADETTKLDLFLEGDGTNAAKVHAAGAFVYAEAA